MINWLKSALAKLTGKAVIYNEKFTTIKECET